MDRFSDLVRADGLVVATTRRDRQRVRRGVARGELEQVAPDVHVAAGSTLDTAARVNALQVVDPDAVVLGAAAAALSWWPEVVVPEILATRPGKRAVVAGFRWTRATFPDGLLVTRGGVRLAGPALSTLQLTMQHGGTAIDEALRRRACSLAELWAAHALLAGRRGTRAWRPLLEDSRDQPWSPAERNFHRHFRGSGCLVRHVTNHPVRIDERTVFLDLALPDLMLSFEVDGYRSHSARDAFEWDRDRGTQLACLGWQEVRWSASFVECQGGATRRRLRAIIAARATALGVPVREVLRPE